MCSITMLSSPIHRAGITQQNAVLVEEAAASAESMLERARHLAQLVKAFKLKRDARHCSN